MEARKVDEEMQRPLDLCQIGAQEKPVFYFLNKGVELFCVMAGTSPDHY